MESFLDSLAMLSYSPPGWGGALLRGLASTLMIALGAFFLGLIIGLFGALGKMHGNWFLRWALEIYTTFIRAVPELVLILLLFYAGSDLINTMLQQLDYGPVNINALVAGIVVLGVVMGAYATEVFRGAISAIPKGQLEAARAYGLDGGLLLRRIIIPAMLPLAIPGLANLWLIVVKETALLAVIGSIELGTVTKRAAGGTRAYFLFYGAAACLYLFITLVSNVFIDRIEKYFRRGTLVQMSGA